jgi:hypothetical protein
MTAADIKKYPKFAAYVSKNIPEVRFVPAIIATIKKLAGDIKADKIKKALEWGSGPMIKIVDTNAYEGEFTPDENSQEIRIRKRRVDEFEAGKGLVKTPNGKLVYFVGVTLLHELTHWADDQDGVDTPGEEGEQFETAMYGGVVNAAP